MELPLQLKEGSFDNNYSPKPRMHLIALSAPREFTDEIEDEDSGHFVDTYFGLSVRHRSALSLSYSSIVKVNISRFSASIA